MENYVGVFSWKFPFKAKISKEKLARVLAESNEDVVIFCYQIKPYLGWTNSKHPGFLKLFVPLCADLGIQPKEPIYTVYANQFVAKLPVYQDYVNNCLIPAMELLETEKYKEVWQDSTYKGLPPYQLQQFTGLTYYPMHTFLLERLMSMWIDHRRLSCKVIT